MPSSKGKAKDGSFAQMVGVFYHSFFSVYVSRINSLLNKKKSLT